MMSKIEVKYFVWIVLFCNAGCKEKFTPTVDKQLKAVVIEGLISNLKESYKVKVSMTSPYDSALNIIGVRGAKVSIKDDAGNNFVLHETPLWYYSDTSEFVALPGRYYTLDVEMPNGEIYESEAEKLSAPPYIDFIYGNRTSKEYWYVDLLGKIRTLSENGTETFADINIGIDSTVQFRFDNTLVDCYSFDYLYTESMKLMGKPFPQAPVCNYPPCPYVIYCWQKYKLATNFTTSFNNTASNRITKSTICFFPTDEIYYPKNDVLDSCGVDSIGKDECRPIKQPEGFGGKILETRIYALNEQTSLYYKKINAQLSANGKLFDPLTVQIQGNMKCINDPNKLVLGNFEVSSCTIKTFWISNTSDGYVNYEPIRDISDIPDHGISQVVPDYWKIFSH